MISARGHRFFIAFAILLASMAIHAAEPSGTLAGARESDLFSTPERLAHALDQGCCFGQEARIAGWVARELGTCPGDPARVHQLSAVLAPIINAIAIEDPGLARQVFLEQPLACARRRPAAWDAYIGLITLSGDALTDHAPDALERAVRDLLATLRQHPQHFGPVLDWLKTLINAGHSLPPLASDTVGTLIALAGNRLYELVDLFDRLPEPSATRALLQLAEQKDLSVPPELARWTSASDIRIMALRKLQNHLLDEQALQRVHGLTRDPDARVAAAAHHLLTHLKMPTRPEEGRSGIPQQAGPQMTSEVAPRALGELRQRLRKQTLTPEYFLDVFVPLGYGTLRTLAETCETDLACLRFAATLVEKAETLASKRVAAGASGPMLPSPDEKDLPWLTEWVVRNRHDPQRLGLLLRVTRLREFGRSPELQRRAWQSGLTPALLQVLTAPGGCEAVRPAIHHLLGRMQPPDCRLL